MAVNDLTFVLASANSSKIIEIRSVLPKGYILHALKDVNISHELPETTGTFQGNAMQKAREVYRLTGFNSIADDSGLIVPALNNQPGVDSAFYSGYPRSDQRNNEKLLREMKNITSREAYFTCVIALILEGKEFIFEGRLEGFIADTISGSQGFGYDPVFIPRNSNSTLAQLSSEEKNKISHRSRALNAMINHLQSIHPEGNF